MYLNDRHIGRRGSPIIQPGYDVAHIESAGIQEAHIAEVGVSIEPVAYFGYQRGEDGWHSQSNGLIAGFPGGAANPTELPDLPGYAFSSASAQYLGIGAVASLMPTKWLIIEAWFRLGTMSSLHWIAGSQERVNADDAWMLYHQAGNLCFSVNHYSTYRSFYPLTDTTKPHHAIGAYDGTRTWLWVDKQLGTLAASCGADISYRGGGSVSMGRCGAAPYYYWNGDIYELAIDGGNNISTYHTPQATARFEQARRIYGV